MQATIPTCNYAVSNYLGPVRQLMARTSYTVRTRQCRLPVLHDVTVFERLPSPCTLPRYDYDTTGFGGHLVPVAPLASVSRSAACSCNKCTNACLPQERRNSHFRLPVCHLTSLWDVTDGLTLKMTALQSFETSAAERLTTQHNHHKTPL
jgi:hypothetical protein